MRRLARSRWPSPPASRSYTVTMHRVGSSYPGRYCSSTNPCTHVDLRTGRSYLRTRNMLSYTGTGCLLQTISIHLSTLCSLDVNERHVFVIEPYVVRVFSRENGIEVMCIPAEAAIWCSHHVEDPFLISGGWFTTALSVSPEVDESPRPEFLTGVFTHTL